MDVTSYLLGKQAGGGGSSTLQNKSVTITENGTTNVTADSGYDGLSKVEVTTNVSGGSTGVYTLAIDTSLPMATNGLSSKIIKISPTLDTSQVTDFRYFFANSPALTEIPELNTSNATNVSYMFSNCTNLATIPVLDFSRVTNIESTYQNCHNFTDQTLDNILVSLIMAKPMATYYKNLSKQGFKVADYPAERIQALPHYQDFLNAGWTIGY